MQISFATPTLRRCYEDYDTASRLWGPDVGRRYIGRVNVLREARTLGDLATPRSLHLHPLHGERDGQYAINIDQRWRLIFTHVKESGDIRVEEVTNHYGD